ncbi:MAG: TetR/AcrR family transcriptional regulator [Mycobacterium sp.]
MDQPDRPLRADAARNRARVLEVAYETFASSGLGVPIDEIARRAGVGAGTVYRHFPTKEVLFQAVFDDRVRRIVENGRSLLVTQESGEALFAFLREMARTGATDLGLVDAMGAFGTDVVAAAPDAEEEFLILLGELLTAAQGAGTVRSDIGVPEIKALMVVCMMTQGHQDLAADRVIAVIEDGLRSLHST